MLNMSASLACHESSSQGWIFVLTDFSAFPALSDVSPLPMPSPVLQYQL